jgi:hypothetical protein
MGAIILAWLISQAPSFAVSLAIELLKKTGVVSAAQAQVTEAGVTVLHAVGNLKTYSSPSDFPSEVKQNGP